MQEYVSFWDGVASGRIALISGDVQELVAVGDSQIQPIPVVVKGEKTILTFYTEDWTDFDYNDSFVIITLNAKENSNSLEPNQHIDPDKDGTLLVNHKLIDNIMYLANTYVFFHDNGAVRRGTIKYVTTINKVIYKSGSTIGFL